MGRGTPEKVAAWSILIVRITYNIDPMLEDGKLESGRVVTVREKGKIT